MNARSRRFNRLCSDFQTNIFAVYLRTVKARARIRYVRNRDGRKVRERENGKNLLARHFPSQVEFAEFAIALSRAEFG